MRVNDAYTKLSLEDDGALHRRLLGKLSSCGVLSSEMSALNLEIGL